MRAYTSTCYNWATEMHFLWLRLTVASKGYEKVRLLLRHTFTWLRKNWHLLWVAVHGTEFFCKAMCKYSPVFDHFLLMAKMAQEPRVEQVHDGMFFPSDVQIHRHPVVCQRRAERAERGNGHFLKTCFATIVQIRQTVICTCSETNYVRENWCFSF